MNKAFKYEYTDIEWEYDDDLFKAWREGKTGFPIGMFLQVSSQGCFELTSVAVDAAMRQANYMVSPCEFASVLAGLS